MYEGEGSNGRTVLSEDDAEENVLPLIEVHRGGLYSRGSLGEYGDEKGADTRPDSARVPCSSM